MVHLEEIKYIIQEYIIKPVVFLLDMSFPIKSKAILVGMPQGKYYYDNCKYFFEYAISRNEFEVKILTKSKKKYSELTSIYPNLILYSYSLGALLYYIKCKYVFISHGNSDLFPFYGVGPFKKIINLWHGTPLKAIGRLQKNKRKKDNINNVRFHYLLSSTRFTTDIFKKVLNIKSSNIWELGQPRNDYLHNFRHQKIQQKYILYAPTYRKFWKTEVFPFHDYDGQKLIHFLQQHNLKIIYRGHINDGKNQSKIQELIESKVIEISNQKSQNSVEDILLKSSMLITDYSSIAFDYLILNRPIMYFNYDQEEFEQKEGFSIDYNTNISGPTVNSMHDLMQQISTYLMSSERDGDLRMENYRKFTFAQVGQSSKLIYDKLLDLEKR